MQFHSQQLDNGLQIIGEINPLARSVAVGFWVRTGSRDESPEVSGVSHFLEHMVFKGTPRRTAFDVNSDFDRIGASYNAYTSEENTVFYAAVLPEYVPMAVDILADILRPTLPPEDFETEKEVIIEEIGMYEDQPMWSAYDQAKQLYFANHPLGNSILGTVESIRQLTRDQMLAYFQRRYVPSNITVVAAGNFDWKAFVRLVREHCGSWEKGTARRQGIRDTQGACEFAIKTKETVNQENLVIISPGPPAKSSLRYAAGILAMIVGDDSGSRLYWSLIDRGLADSADMSFHEYDGTGAFYTMLSCVPELAQKDLNIVQREFKKLQNNGITEEELQQAKNKVLGRLVRSSERPMGRMQAIGHNWLYQRTYLTIDEELKAFGAVTRAKIGQVQERYPFGQGTTLALGPLEKLRRPSTNSRK